MNTNIALDDACASIGRGAWWHGHVDSDVDGATRSWIVIELDTEPDEYARMWATTVSNGIEANTLVDMLDALATDTLANPGEHTPEDVATAQALAVWVGAQS